MRELMMNDEGLVVDAKGVVVEMDGEPIKIGNAQNEEQVKTAIQSRLARQTDKIRALEAQANKTPEIQAVLEQEKSAREKLENDLANAQRSAEKRVEAQLSEVKKARDTALQSLEQEQIARVRDHVSTVIIGAAKNDFVDPGSDIVPRLLPKHKREPVMGSDGKEVPDQYLDLFKMTFQNEKGDEVTEALPVDKALDVFKSQERFQHYLRGGGDGGKGGSIFKPGGRMISKMSDYKKLSPEAQDAFIDAHGADGVRNLSQD